MEKIRTFVPNLHFIMVTIKQVETKKELKQFIRFNYELYKDNPYSVPDLYEDMLDTFSDKNPAMDFCEAAYFLAYKDGKIVGGHSAKKEQSKIMAVRRAIFVLPGHAEEVQAAIKEAKPHRILILGTSENMVFKIAKALHLPHIAKIIHIEDVATKQEMERAF